MAIDAASQQSCLGFVCLSGGLWRLVPDGGVAGASCGLNQPGTDP